MKPADISIVVREARRQERERCARLAERIAQSSGDGEGEVYIAKKIARRIRRLRSH